MILPERRTVTGRHGWAVRVTCALSGVDVVATLDPESPEERWVPHGMVEEGKPSSQGAHVGERGLGIAVGYRARALERRGRAGVKTFSWEPRAAVEPVQGQRRGRGSRPGQREQGRVEAGG